MLLSWIIKTIPRSPRAFLALVVMLGSTSLLFSALTELFAPNGVNTTMTAVKFVVGLLIGLPSTALFYYWQHMDQTQVTGVNRLELLNNYAQAEKRDRIFKQSSATPVFTSLGGQVPSQPEPSPTQPPKHETASPAQPAASTTYPPDSRQS
jgi:hypothetical protein